MAENTGTFFPEADNVIAQVHDDLLLAQKNRLAEEQAANAQAAALQRAQGAAATKEQSAYLKQLEAQRKADAKAIEAERKRLDDIKEEIPLAFGSMYGSQGRTVQAMADDLAQNFDQYMEQYGERTVMQLIEQVDLAADELIKSYSDTQKQANTNIDNSRKQPDFKGTKVAFDADGWIQNQAALNEGEVSPFEIGNGQWSVGGMAIGDWVKQTVQTNNSFVQAEEIPDFAPTTVQAWDAYSGAYTGINYDTMSQVVDANLYESPEQPHGWSYTARKQYYDKYIKEESAKAEREGKTFIPMTMDDFFINEGEMSDLRRDRAYSEFKNEWMDLWVSNQKDTTRASREREARNRQSAEEFAKGIRFNTVYDSYNMKSNLFAEFNSGTVPVSEEEIEAAGITGLAQIPSRLELNLESLQMEQFGLDPTDSTARLEGVSFNSNGDLYVMYSGKLTDEGQSEFGLNDDIMRDLGIEPSADEESRSKQFASRVIKFGGQGWANLMREIGDKMATTSESNRIAKFYEDIGSEVEANFYLGVLAVANTTNNKMLDEAVADIKSKGITEQEIKDLLESR
jgi:hypothetical protein